MNISNDGWYGDSGAYAQHLSQARMRAIENNRWLLRDTNTGVTACDRSVWAESSPLSPAKSALPWLRPTRSPT